MMKNVNLIFVLETNPLNVLFILNHVRTTPYTLQRNQHFQCFTVNSSQHQLNVYVHSKLLYYIL